jgi:chromosome segregation ATPase
MITYLLAKIHSKTAIIHQELNYLTRALDRTNTSVMMKNSKKESLAHKITSIEHELRASLENTKYEREEVEKHKEELKEAKLNLDSTEIKLTQLSSEIADSEKQVILHRSEISVLEEEKEGRKQDRKIKEALEDLKKYEKGYHGLFYELIHPIQSKYEIAIKVALQGVLKMLVVESVEVAHRVDEYLTEKGLYLDCLILSKVPKEGADIHGKRKKLEGKGHMVVDVVDCDKGIKGLEGALRFF